LDLGSLRGCTASISLAMPPIARRSTSSSSSASGRMAPSSRARARRASGDVEPPQGDRAGNRPEKPTTTRICLRNARCSRLD
jgi:hypothetical protein